MRVLITGGAGFLGSHLCDRFLAEGHEVIAIDNLLTGKTQNINHLAGHDRFRYIKQDVTEYLYIDGQLDAILHFASPASPDDYLQYPIQTLKVGALGTHKTLGLAREKGARYLLASTSEVYGDPLVHPQPESYWGNVNPIGPRGVYDEAKRFAEAMTMAYHRYHGLDTRIVRIFNSVLADEMIFLFNDEECHIEAAQEYASRIEQRDLWRPLHIQVPTFDPQTLAVELRPASAFIKHAALGKDAYLVRTRYGRQIKVTGDHSLFKRDERGQPVATPVRQLVPGDSIAIPAHLPVIERDVPQINIGQSIIQRCQRREDLWEHALVSPALSDVVAQHKQRIVAVLMQSGRFDGSRNRRTTVGCAYRNYLHKGILPLAIVAELQQQVGFEWPAGGHIRPYGGGGGIAIPNHIAVSDDLLWLLGLFLAEGTGYTRSGTHGIQLCSDERFVLRAKRLLQQIFKVNPGYRPASSMRGPVVYANSRLLGNIFTIIFGVTGPSDERRVPAWVFQLPLSRLKHFLEGYRQGDGPHTNSHEERELAFNTSSERLATDLTYVLLRFGIVAWLGQYETTARQRYGERRLPLWRVTASELDNFDILTWDQAVPQRLDAGRTGDLVWVLITSIEPTEVTAYVYDFAVPGSENFVAGNGVFAHNTYGPRMRINDGRVVPNFLTQALRRQPLTVYGDGSQTRSFAYVSDLVEGIYRLLLSDEVEPVNLGNPNEFTILQFAHLVNQMTENPAGITFKPLPVDDPKIRQPDITRARRLLGWEPTVPLEAGIRYTLPYFRERLGLSLRSPV